MVLKKINLAVLAVFMMAVSSTGWTASREGDQGYGVVLGNPTGITGKFWLDDIWALDGAVGVARSEFDVHATLLHHIFGWEKGLRDGEGLHSKAEFPVYVGIGPRVLFEDDTELGVRFPFGLSFLPHASPWEVFLEFVPVLRLTPNAGFNGDFGLGFRYYFQSYKPRSSK